MKNMIKLVVSLMVMVVLVTAHPITACAVNNKGRSPVTPDGTYYDYRNYKWSKIHNGKCDPEWDYDDNIYDEFLDEDETDTPAPVAKRDAYRIKYYE